MSLVEHIAAQRTDFGVPHTVACLAGVVGAAAPVQGVELVHDCDDRVCGEDFEWPQQRVLLQQRRV
ncbi:MAG: hypothetical protein OXL98_15530 [Acidimicrobiaceae bacterium]|nr:hypothetical protein [Acidimicrobiaceae bacterium]